MNGQAHVGPGLEPLASRPGLEQGFLHQVVGEIAAARERAAKRAQMRNHRPKLDLEFRVVERHRFGPNFYLIQFLIVFVGQIFPPAISTQRA